MREHFEMVEKTGSFLSLVAKKLVIFVINIAGLMKFMNEFQSHFLITLVKINSSI